MADEWPLLTLDEAGVSLIDCDHRTPPAADGGYPYVAIPQMKEGHIDIRDARRITPENFVEWTRKARPIANDVVLSRRCNPGETAYVPAGLEFALGQNLVLLRADGNRVYQPFLRWVVRGPEWWEQIRKFLNVGAVFDSLKCADVPKFQLRIPPLEDQRRIARVLNAFDDKIRLARQMNATLEAIARALFKAWFVDFETVRANSEGHVSPSDRFRRPAVDSEVGEAPEGWKSGPLSDLATLNPEVWSAQTRPTRIDYIDLSNAKWGRIESVASYASTDAPSRAQRVLRAGDTIVGTVRPGNGSYAYIAEDGLTGSTGFAVLRPKRPEYRAFVYLAATARVNIEALAHLADGGAYPAVRGEAVAATAVIRAEDRVLDAFASVTQPMLERISANERESRSLSMLRDTLLPRLLSGQVRVSATAPETATATA